MKKALVCTAVLAGMTLSGAAGVAAAANSIVGLDAYGAIDYTAAAKNIQFGAYQTARNDYSTNSGFPAGTHWKLWVKSTSAEPATAMIIETLTGKIMAACPIPAYGNMVYYDRDFANPPLLKNDKTYHVQLITGGGNLTGSSVALRTADFEIDKLYEQNPLIDDYGTDWSKVDTSMCVPGTEYYKIPEDGITRPIFSGFVYGVPQGIPTQDILGKNLMAISNYRFITDLVFQPGEAGKVQFTLNDSQDYAKSDIYVTVYDKTTQTVLVYYKLENTAPTPSSMSCRIDPTHTYSLYISHGGTGLQNESLNILAG